MTDKSFKRAYGVLQQHAQTLRDQEEPNIDDLLKIVTESVAAFSVCRERIDAVEAALKAALDGAGMGTSSSTGASTGTSTGAVAGVSVPSAAERVSPKPSARVVPTPASAPRASGYAEDSGNDIPF